MKLSKINPTPFKLLLVYYLIKETVEVGCAQCMLRIRLFAPITALTCNSETVTTLHETKELNEKNCRKKFNLEIHMK